MGTLLVAWAAFACSPAPEGLAPAAPARTTVKMDFFHKPLPEIALPNDVATRYDPSSATRRRINASMLAPTAFESQVRQMIDQLDGWGVFQPISVPFTGPLDVRSIVLAHRDADYDLSDDVIFLVNIDRASPHFGRIHYLDLGGGNYPVVLEKRDNYGPHDPRGDSISIVFEEVSEDHNRNGVLDAGEDLDGDGVLDPGEDLNGNGVLDPPEDTDADGMLDLANYLPGEHPAPDDLAGRADALMTFYERTTDTLIARPMVPLDERTRYAVVVTRRILDAGGESVGSPYAFINHAAQTEELRPLLDAMPPGLALEDVAFAYAFTTQSVQAHWQAVRDGLYGHGAQAHLGAEFPAELASIEPMRDASAFPNMKMPQLLYGESWKPVLEMVAKEMMGQAEGEMLSTVIEGTGYVDFFVVGSYNSPQLFPRWDAQGALLPLDSQAWPPDLDLVPAPARSETVYFTLAVPRREVSVRAQGKSVPIVLLGHGYGGNRFDVMEMASYVCRHGLAVLSIDGPSHGIDLDAGQQQLALALGAGLGVGAGVEALLRDRALDQNGDGRKDSGADFWSAYLFHTRDIVRQYALDLMQLLRIVRSFNGARRWQFDLNGDGQNELAGDFDADGALDIGLASPIGMFGGSLGGIMSLVMGSVEPALEAVAPIAGGGGYSDIGIRSKQGGVPEAFLLRAMGPLFVRTFDKKDEQDPGRWVVATVVPDLNSEATRVIAPAEGLEPWDTMVVVNLRTAERRCGFVAADGGARVGIASNAGDPVQILFYEGPQALPGTDCEIRPGARPGLLVESFTESFDFQGRSYEAGEPLVALSEGLGMRRGHPDLRGFQGLGQLVLDPADPAVLARHLLIEPLRYPGAGDQTGTHALVITTMGDMNVPASSGVAVGRAAGLIDYLEADPRYGKPDNQEIIDTYTAEAVNTLKRYTNSQGEGIHLDVENFSGGDDMYGAEVPRLDPPLRIGMSDTDPLGGKSAAIFPYNVPGGQHGFDMPGGMTDRARQQCRDACAQKEGDDPCGCGSLETFDIGNFMMNMIGRYLATSGHELRSDRCLSSSDCAGFASLPPARDPQKLP
ncbi:MAG: hypothetical protein HY744_25260 [Deltaproteobacteria bacterium]|nr:hypothetical protein [Deltaproteobacteria bacterium]